MTRGYSDVWPIRDLVIVWTGLALATVVVLRNKSLRERIALIAAGVVLVIVNVGLLFWIRPGDRWWGLLPLLDVLFWLATAVCVFFNRLAEDSSPPDKDKT